MAVPSIRLKRRESVHRFRRRDLSIVDDEGLLVRGGADDTFGLRK